MRALVSLLASALVLTACASDAKNIRLEDVDVSDMHTLQALRTQLSAREGAALASYALRHDVQSSRFCGRKLIDASGRSPQTIGEAIDLTLAREAEEASRRAEAAKPKSSGELAREAWDDLISERDLLIDAQSRVDEGSGYQTKGAARESLARRLASVDERLTALKPLVFGPQ